MLLYNSLPFGKTHWPSSFCGLVPPQLITTTPWGTFHRWPPQDTSIPTQTLWMETSTILTWCILLVFPIIMVFPIFLPMDSWDLPIIQWVLPWVTWLPTLTWLEAMWILISETVWVLLQETWTNFSLSMKVTHCINKCWIGTLGRKCMGSHEGVSRAFFCRRYQILFFFGEVIFEITFQNIT